MKKSLWIGFVGPGNRVAVGYDGTNLRVACTDQRFENYVKRTFASKWMRNLADSNDDFDFAEYVGTSSIFAFGESIEWNEEAFQRELRLILKSTKN